MELGLSLGGIITGVMALVSLGVAWGRISLKLDILWRAFEKSLESRHGQLFTRSSQKKELTPEGEQALPEKLKFEIQLRARKGMKPRDIIGKILDMIEDEGMLVAARVYIDQIQSDNTSKRLRWPWRKG